MVRYKRSSGFFHLSCHASTLPRGPPLVSARKMGALQLLACLWTLLVIPTGSVYSNIQFFERQAGESVDLHCSMDQRHKEPFGVYLKRSWLHPTEVLFMHTMTEFSMHNNQDRSRTSVHGDPRNHSLDVTISELKVSDTDRYYCEFVVANPSSEDERIPATSEFFLLVSNGGQCGCSSYSTLLYALTSAVVILFLLLGLVLIYQNLRHSGRSHPQAPIYEEMTGVLPLKQKLGPRHLEETESSEYFNCHKKKSCPENHYESPIGTRGARSVPKISQEESHVPQE